MHGSVEKTLDYLYKICSVPGRDAIINFNMFFALMRELCKQINVIAAVEMVEARGWKCSSIIAFGMETGGNFRSVDGFT